MVHNNLHELKRIIKQHLKDEEIANTFMQIVKSIERDIIASEFRLKRTLRDRQITTNVLSATIQSLKEKGVSIEKQKHLIEKQSKFKEKLFANVSHELRTPLHGISGMNQLLEKTNLDDQQKGYVDIIKNSADNLLVIINDILSFSKINAGKVNIINEPFSINKLCIDLENILTLKAKKKGLNLICMYPPNLPEFLIGDRTRLYQILLNLLNNALKFTHLGYIALNIYILHQNENQLTLQFEVRDTGIGINPERLDLIFDSFTRVHENNGVVYEGAGLGLNIVKNLLNMMDGEIEVKSKKGQGTSFLIKLSFSIPDEDTIKIFKNKRSELIIPAHWRYKNILLIEDNQANLLFAKNMFMDWGIELNISETISDAWDKVGNQKFDCILSDVKLPDGNGLEFIKKLREDTSNTNQHTPVIVLTASSNDKEAEYSKSIKIQSYMGKPFKAELLVEELKNILDQPNIVNVPRSSSGKPTKTIEKEHYFQPLEKNFSGKNKLKVEMMDIFLNQIPDVLCNMDQALNKKDFEAFYFEAHNIKSTINNIGLPKLEPLILKINEYCYKKIHLNELPDLFKSFKRLAIDDIQILLKEKDRLSACV